MGGKREMLKGEDKNKRENGERQWERIGQGKGKKKRKGEE